MSTTLRDVRRLPLILPVVLALPVLTALTAAAAPGDNVICVNTAVAACTPGQSAASISAAIAQANSNSVADTILVGPGVYNDGPYVLVGTTTHALTLKGANQGLTVLTLPPSASSQIYVNAQGATVQALSIVMAGGADSNDRAIQLSAGATVDHVTIDGTSTVNASGITSINSTVVSSAIDMPPTSASGSRAIYSDGNTTVLDADMTASQGFARSGTGVADTLSRVSIRADYQAITVDGGTIDVDDVFIDLGASAGTGLFAGNYNAGVADKAINADHLTIVGGGTGSTGVHAWAARPEVPQNSTVNLSNSIIRGPATSLVTDAGNNGSMTVSTATLNVSYTDFQTTGGDIDGATGAGGVVQGAGNLIDVDPQFADPAGGDYRPTSGSPVVDKGNPAAGGPALDLDQRARVVDFDATPGAVRDMGAYELQDTTPPQTTITGGPAALTADATPTFRFTSEAGASFECRVDAGAFTPCASPRTTAKLGNGAHTFAVRARDAYLNADLTPAVRSFRVDTVGPVATFKKKPGKLVFGGTVTFRFASSEPGSTFQCAIDGGKLKKCKAKKKFKVGLGKHKVQVRATDALGNQGKVVKYSFRRIEPCSGEC